MSSRVALLKGGHLFAQEVLLNNLGSFRRQPAKFLSSKRVSADDFVHGLLQALYDDEIAEEKKLQLLAVLHEFDQILLADSTRLEHVLATLLAMLVRGSASNYTFKGEVLITSTAIMIQHDFLTVQPKTLGRFIDSLFKIIQGSNNNQDAFYRRTACQCLHEFELCFPGCLARKLGHLAKLCVDENSFAAEAYAVLLAAALRNAVLLINQKQDGSTSLAARQGGGSNSSSSGGGSTVGDSSSGKGAADAAAATATDGFNTDGGGGKAAGGGGGNDEGGAAAAAAAAADDNDVDSNRDAASPDIAEGLPQTLDDLLLTNVENLLPYNESAVAQNTALATFGGHEGRVAYDRLESGSSPENITSSVAFLMDNVGLLNPPAMLAVVCALAECASSASVKPQVFTRAYLAMLSSKDMVCVHVLVILHLWYGEELVTNDLDMNAVANKLLFGLNGSGLSVPDCAVSLAWLQGCPGLLPTGSGEAVTRDARGCLLPRVFDSPEVMARKIGVLAELCRGFAMANNGGGGGGGSNSKRKKKGGGGGGGGGRRRGSDDDDDDADGDDGDNDTGNGDDDSSVAAYDTATFLMEALVCFADHTAFQPTDRPVRALFQSLYLLYAEGMRAAGTRDGARLCEDTYAVLLKTVSKCPKFVMNAVDVGECVYNNHPTDTSHAGRPLLLALLEEFTAAMVNSTDAELLTNLSHHLVLLGRLAKEVSISPGPYIDRLHALLTTSDICNNGDWNMGGDILNVCRMLIYAQPTAVLLRPLGNLLRYVWVAHADIDIRDNARFYYMLLTNVAGEPLAQILKPHETTRSSLSSMMTDNMLSSSKYQPADPISAVSTTFLAMKRLGQWHL